MSCETRTDTVGSRVGVVPSLSETAISRCMQVSTCGTQISHHFHLTHSLRLRPALAPSSRLSYNCRQRGKWQWAMLYPRSPSSAPPPQRFCMDGWPRGRGRPVGLPPSLLLLRRATNYHTFGSESASTSRPPIVRTRPKCERAKTYSIYRSNYTAVLAFYCAHCAE